MNEKEYGAHNILYTNLMHTIRSVVHSICNSGKGKGQVIVYTTVMHAYINDIYYQLTTRQVYK